MLKMKWLLIALFLTGVSALAPSSANNTRSYFRFWYIRGYALRTGVDETRSLAVTSSIDWGETDKILDKAWERYEKAVATKQLAKITINGTTEDAIEFAADQIWERTGGKLVDKVLTTIGSSTLQWGGSRYVGGELGMVLGLLFPEISIPLVVAGVFLGGHLGKALGQLGGKIGASLANDFIEEKVIHPAALEAMAAVVNATCANQSTNGSVTCRSDALSCAKPYAQLGCNCVGCFGPQEYQDRSGQSSCKFCLPGHVPWYHTACSSCDKGEYGPGDGECHFCGGPTEYQDEKGQSKCKTCGNGHEVGCSHQCCNSCDKGHYGPGDGSCHFCGGENEYQDERGQSSCKICPDGQIPGASHQFCSRPLSANGTLLQDSLVI